MSSTGLLLLVMVASVQGLEQDADCAGSKARMAKWGNYDCKPETSGCEMWTCISAQGLCSNHKEVCVSKEQAVELRECAAYGSDKSKCDANEKCAAVGACGFTTCAGAGATTLKNETEVCASTPLTSPPPPVGQPVIDTSASAQTTSASLRLNMKPAANLLLCVWALMMQ